MRHPRSQSGSTVQWWHLMVSFRRPPCSQAPRALVARAWRAWLWVVALVAASYFSPHLAFAADCGAYADDLQEMLKADQAMRELVDPTTVIGAKSPPPAMQRVQLVDRVNTSRLATWIRTCGWPRRSTMGDAAVGAAWTSATLRNARAYRGGMQVPSLACG